MKVQITHLKAPWPHGAVVGDVLDLPGIPVWAAGKCVTIESGEGEGMGQPLPVIDDEPVRPKGKHK